MYLAAIGVDAIRVGRKARLTAIPVVWAIFPALHFSHAAAALPLTAAAADRAARAARNGGVGRMICAGVLGCGYWGAQVVCDLRSCGAFEVAAICDLDPVRRERALREQPEAAVLPDPADLLRDPTLDCIAVVTPAQSHFELAMAAIAAGKHVWIEKPITASSEQGRRRIGVARISSCSSHARPVLGVQDLYRNSPSEEE